jgi:hypothetical protein
VPHSPVSPAGDSVRPGAQPDADTAVFELSVVIPCLNEAGTIAACVSAALAAMAASGIRGEVVVSDNGSTDGSVARAGEAGARVVHCPTRGYGAALQYGFRQARGRYLIMGDADESYDFGLLSRFVERTRAGARFVIGSRIRGRIDRGAMPLLHRYVGTPVLTAILNRLFATAITDCNCGMRCIERATFFSLGVTSRGMEFASEMVVKAAVQGVPITEVAIDFHRDRRGRRPHLRPFRDGWRHLRLLLSHAPDHMMTVPGLVLLALGWPLVIAQLAGPLDVAGQHFDIHYMILGVTMALIGTSATTLGLVVGSLMPRGKVRQIRGLAAAHRWFTFDNAAALAAVCMAAGFLTDGFVLGYWLYTGHGELTPWFTRRTLFGLVLISTGVQIALSALVLSTAATADAVEGIEEQPASAPSRPARATAAGL